MIGIYIYIYIFNSRSGFRPNTFRKDGWAILTLIYHSIAYSVISANVVLHFLVRDESHIRSCREHANALPYFNTLAGAFPLGSIGSTIFTPWLMR